MRFAESGPAPGEKSPAGYRPLHGLDDAGELGDHGIAPGIDDPPVMALDQPGNGGAVAV
ncbi:MAG: hypothetical protein ACHQPH_06950 [Reyranellales bacterium]